MIRTTREHQRPHFKPQDLTTARQKARYSDTGFQLLIRIVETITDLPFYDLLRERIFRPLGLTCTWLPGQYPPDPATAAPSPFYARQRRVELTSMIESSNDLFSTTGDLRTFQRALLDGELFSDARSLELLTEQRNRLRNIPVLRYGLGTMFFKVGRLISPRHRPVTLVGHSGATGTWLFHCPKLDLHLVGTVDQTKGAGYPLPVHGTVSGRVANVKATPIATDLPPDCYGVDRLTVRGRQPARPQPLMCLAGATSTVPNPVAVARHAQHAGRRIRQRRTARDQRPMPRRGR